MQKHFILFLLTLFAFGLKAQDDPSPVTKTFALKNVTIVQVPGKVIEQGTLIIKNGLIQAVGKNITVPFDAKVIKADSMYVYAGFIDGASHVGIPRAEEPQGQGGRGQRPQVKDPGNPPNDIAGIQPERPVRTMLKADEKSIEDMRKLGFTVAHVVPTGKMLPGTGAIILLEGTSINEMIVKENTSLFAQFTGAGFVAPSTTIGVMSKLRDLYFQAQQTKTHAAAYLKNPTGMSRPESNPVLEAFYPVIDKKLPLFMKAETAKDISRALILQSDMGYNLVLTDVKQGWDYAAQLKTIPTFLSLNLPPVKEVKKEEKKKEDTAKSPTAAELEAEELEKRRAATMKEYEAQAAKMAAAGVVFGFSTLEAKTKDIKGNFTRMIEAGLTTDQALAALTTNPAKMLGIDNIAGTVEKGKMANLVISDAPYFDKESNVRFVFVDGQVFEYEAKPKKKPAAAGSEEKPAKIDGKWSYTFDAGGQQMSGSFVFVQDEENNISGTASSPQGAGNTNIENVELKGNLLTFSISWQGITVEYELTFEENSYDGKVTAGQFGTFDIEGTKLPQ